MLLLVALFAVSLPAVTSRLYSSDEIQYFSYLRSLYFDHDVSFENEYRHFYDSGIARYPGFHETFLERTTDAGRRINFATLGSAILWTPFYAVADLVTRATGIAAADGFSSPYVRAVSLGSAFYAFLAILLSIRGARIVLGPVNPWIAGLAVWLGTPLLFYMYVAPPFSHAPSAFAAALFVNVWLHVRARWTPAGAAALGACAALLAMVREQDVFLAVGPAADFLLSSMSREARASLARRTMAAITGLVTFAVCYAPQLFAYLALNGRPGPASHVSRKMFWYAPHGLQVLASPAHGFFIWTPLAVLSIAGLVLLSMGRRERHRIGLVLLLMVFSQAYVAGSVASWTVAGAFGQRRFVCLTVVLAIGLAALWQRWPRRALGAVIALCVWWNIALMAQFATRLMDRQRLEPARNAYHAFVTLPVSLPTLAYRYLFDRASFYEPPARQP